jgi:Glycosyltransferase
MIAACPFPWPRGTPVRIHRIAEAVARRGHEVHVVTYHLGEDLADPPFAVHRIRDVAAYRQTDPGPTLRKLLQLDPMLAGLLRRLHREIRFDLVHAHHYEGLLVASHALRGTPVVYDAHTLLASELPSYPLGLPRRCLRAVGPWLDRHLPRRADRIIAVSETIRQTLLTLGASTPERTHVIPNGVEWDRFPIEGEIAPNGRTVIFTGNLAPVSGGESHARGVRRAAGATGRRAPDDRDGLAVHALRATGAAAWRAGRGGAEAGHVHATAGPVGGRHGGHQPTGPLRRHSAEAAQLHGRRPAHRDLRELVGSLAARGDRPPRARRRHGRDGRRPGALAHRTARSRGPWATPRATRPGASFPGTRWPHGSSRSTAMRSRRASRPAAPRWAGPRNGEVAARRATGTRSA